MTINLSTRLFYDSASSTFGSLNATADRLNTQLATGKKLLAPSDDSAAYQRLQTLARAKTDATTDAANVKLAQSVLQQADTTLASITANLQRASELVVQAGDGTLSATAKAAIATELSGILDSIVSLANTKDVRGGPLFGDTNGDVAVTKAADGSLGFADGASATIPIGDGQTVQPSTNAKAFLSTTAGGDIGSALNAIITGLSAGGTVPDGAADDLKSISDATVDAQSSLGARAARVDLVAGQLTTAATDREDARSAIEDVDVTATITELQKTLTVLQATQSSFAKLSSLSLFDYLK